MSDYAPQPDTSSTWTKSFTINAAQVAGTYTLATVSGGAIELVSVNVYVATAPTGLVSVSLQSNDTTGVTYMSSAEGALANLTGGKNAKNYSGPSILASGKLMTYTIVGTGVGGSIQVYLSYRPMAAGATIA